MTDRDYDIDELREELIEDTYALAASQPAAILEEDEIWEMSDAQVLREARRRGLI